MLPVPPRPSLITVSADHLRAALQHGEWTGDLPSERKLCSRLGISRPTLRAVLAQLETEGWLGAVKNKKRLILNPSRSHTKTPATAVITVLSPIPARVMPPFVLFWLDLLRGLLSDAGRPLEIYTTPAAYGPKPEASLNQIKADRPSAAWILFRSTAPMQRWFARSQTPAVIAGTRTADVQLPSVDMDYRATCRHAVSVLKRSGHKHSVLLLPKGTHGGDAESEAGFLEGCQDAHSGLVLRHDETAASLIATVDGVLRRRPVPTAFIVARSVNALTLITHLLRQHHRLPQDFAVISRDDDAFLDHVVPKVARYTSDPSKFARRLAKLVLQLAETGRTTLQPIRLMPEWVKGETV